MRQITDRLLDDMSATGASGEAVDLFEALGYPLPMTVLGELLGASPARRSDFQQWSAVVINGAAYAAETFIDAAAAMVDYIRDLNKEKRAEPADDLLSALITVHEGSDRLTQDELTSMVFLLVAAGYETTAHLICSGAHALLTHPDQLQLLRAQPDLLPGAVEEILRFDGPAQVTIPSVTAAPIRLGEIIIPAGEVVLPAPLATNRDPNRFPEPARFDITRTPNQHLEAGQLPPDLDLDLVVLAIAAPAAYAPLAYGEPAPHRTGRDLLDLIVGQAATPYRGDPTPEA